MRTVIIVLYGLHLIDVGIVLYHKGLDHRIIYDLGTFKHIQQLGIGKVYRGLDSPCKIKGVLSHYFYIVFCAYLVSFVFVLFSFSSILQKGTVLSFLVEAVIELGIPTALYVYFYRKSDKVKIRKDNRVITISNRGLYRALNQRRYGQ